ncbi:MAG: isoprenylcysteine carboxylmethyltransferase family protein [Candidatus Omnitrophota bacterium]|jgi:protein-S-isoprenylcysteine O-methyltransferase Ste14
MHKFQTETIFSSFYLIVIVCFAIERASATFAVSKEVAHQTPQLITTIPLITYCIIAALAIVEYFSGNRPVNYWISALGFSIFLTGIKLRAAAMKECGDNWNIHVSAKLVKKIITTGPYQFIRHPYYLAVILELTGFSLISNSYLTVTAVALIQAPFLLTRIKLEEKELLSRFPDIYLHYKKAVNAFLPLRPYKQGKGI